MTNDDDLIRRGDAMAELAKHAKGSTVIGGQNFRTIQLGEATDAIAALPAVTPQPVGVTVKPLEWKEADHGNFRKGECYHATSPVSFAPLAIHKKHDGWWLNVDCKTHPTIEAAQAAAQADYEARILAALDLTPAAPTVAEAVVVVKEAIAPQISEGIGAILRKFCDSPAASRARSALYDMPERDWNTLVNMLAEESASAALRAMIQPNQAAALEAVKIEAVRAEREACAQMFGPIVAAAIRARGEGM